MKLICLNVIFILHRADKQIEWYFDGRWHSTTYSVKVIDLDLKSVDHIERWYELDQTIVQHAVNSGLDRQCKNA
jgi:hypothetical protein